MNRKGDHNLILALIIMVLVIIFFTDYLYGRNTFKDIGQKVQDLFEFEEKDPTIWNRNFYIERRAALEIFGNISDAFRRVSESKDKDGNPQSTCFGIFQILPDEFFEKDYQIQFRKNEDGSGMVITLLQYRVDETEPDETKRISTWQPVSSPVNIQGFLPCAVLGDVPAGNFHKDIITQWKIQDGSEYAEEVYQFSLRDENKQIFIGKNVAQGDPQANEEKFEFYQGDDILSYFIFRRDGKLCVLPTYGDFFDACSDPENGLIDDDCLDNEADYLPDRIISGELNKHVCSGFEKQIERIVDNS